MVGRYNTLKVVKQVDFGFYLDGGEAGEILLPKRFVPKGLKEGDELEVFVYHDSENRLIATTQKPKGQVGDIVALEVVSSTNQGVFMDWGLMKDIFVPLSQQSTNMYEGEKYMVLIYLDEQTGRVAATQKFARLLSNETLSVQERDAVDLVVWHATDIGYKVIINNRHTGVLHFSDVFRELETGDQLKGYIKNIRPEGEIDVGVGEMGYKRVESELDRVLRLLRENDGYLPYHDKSDPEEIYNFFGMSKKTFKMTTGALYKQRKIEFTQTGIRLLEE